MFADAPVWTAEELTRDSLLAVDVFRKRRIDEPLEEYLAAFDDYERVVEDLLESTVDLADLDGRLASVAADPKRLHALRYLPGPPISEDDLETVAQAVLTAARLKSDAAMAERVARVILNGLDRRRFPWVVQRRKPTEAERGAAVVASAALMATRRLETARRSNEKQRQEDDVKAALERSGLRQVDARPIKVLAHGPGPGEFCGESKLGERKADIVIGLWDGRLMPIECKVSNSSVNSVKRLNNDAAAKAEAWRTDLGATQVVPSAVLSGVYKLSNLQSAQQRGLRLFWAHDIGRLVDWIEATRPPRK
jgi:XamI restriction endonuclease